MMEKAPKVVRIDSERDERGITLSFVRTEKLKPISLKGYPRLTSKMLEQRLAGLAEVKDPIIQFSSFMDLPSKTWRASDEIKNSFINATLTAWSNHRALVVSPDHFWLAILQAVALHVNANSASLRKGFVKHSGKKQIVVRRDGFKLDSRANDWAGVIHELNSKIGETAVEDVLPLLQPQFSTSTSEEELAIKLTVMEVVTKYYDFVVMTLCGFPWIRMEGTAADWEKLRESAEELLRSGKLKREFAEKWAQVLIPVLAKLEQSAQGNPELDFWDGMIKQDSSSGLSWINGWINVFFPVMKGKENPLCFAKDHGLDGETEGESLFTIPVGVSATTVIWDFISAKVELKAIAGFVGFSEEKDGSLRPEVGVAIARSKTASKKGQVFAEAVRLIKGRF